MASQYGDHFIKNILTMNEVGTETINLCGVDQFK
jgi:hypothetical protein